MEQAMSAGDEEIDDAELDAAMDEFDQHSSAIYQMVQDYIDEHDLLEEMMSIVLLNLSVRMRMVGYALDTEKPSASGLKLDLDRFRREMEDGVRAAKKDAERFIEDVKTARTEAESEAEVEPDDKGGAPS
jgi:hypothetical protein